MGQTDLVGLGSLLFASVWPWPGDLMVLASVPSVCMGTVTFTSRCCSEGCLESCLQSV